MRSWFSTDHSPLARYSLWFLLLLVCHMFLIHLDRIVYDLMRGADPRLVIFFRAVTEIGDSKWTLVPTGLLGLVLFVAGRYVRLGHRIAAMCRWLSAAFFFIFASVAMSGIAANLIKAIVGRGRPKLLDQSGFTGFDPFTFNANFHSFPSGHTNTAFALALAVSFLIPRWRSGLLAAAAVVGFSRVAVNAHFLTDVLGGAALAVPTTWWLRQCFADFGLVFTKDTAGEYALCWPGRLMPDGEQTPPGAGRA
jgi:membrane-associated phospholipid phosphatase